MGYSGTPQQTPELTRTLFFPQEQFLHKATSQTSSVSSVSGLGIPKFRGMGECSNENRVWTNSNVSGLGSLNLPRQILNFKLQLGLLVLKLQRERREKDGSFYTLTN